MRKKANSVGGDVISSKIGDHARNVISGKGNIMVNQLVTEKIEKALDAIESELYELREQIEKEASPEKKELALDLVNEFELNVKEKIPVLGSMQRAKKWFRKFLPSLAGKLISIFVNPALGEIVEATGEIAAEELKALFEEGK